MKRVKSVSLFLLGVMLCGCSSDNNSVELQKEDNSSAEQTDFKYPEFKKILLTDLENCDIVFTKEMPFYDFEFRIISTEELDKDNIKIEFDTDMEYEYTVSDGMVVNKEEKFGYSLFCAYNGYEMDNMYELVD